MLPPAAASLDEAHAAIELWEHYKRRRLDPAQRLVVEVMMATRTDGLWAAASTGREMPRQNGKGDEVEVVELWGLVERAERILHTVHDAVLLATQSQERLLSVIEGHADLRRRKSRAWRGTGQQMIEFSNGGIIWYRTRTGGGARGVDEVDRVVVDEAQHAESEHLAAITPTTLASVNPQLNAIGTGAIDGKSVWWWQQRKRALGSDPGDFGYVGHTAERVRLGSDGAVVQEPVDPFNRVLWRDANPALVAGRTGEDYLAEQLRRLGPALFAREHLGVWDPEPSDDQLVAVSVDAWERCTDKDSRIASHYQYALDVSPGQRSAAFGMAGRRADGLVHVETFDTRPGTGWVVDRAVEIWARRNTPIRIDKSSPAAAFISRIQERAVEVVEVSTAEHAQACGQFIDLASNGQLRHLNQLSLDTALRGATLRPTGDADLWGRRSSKVDITPLVAVTLALGGVPADGVYDSEFVDLDDYGDAEG